MSNRSDSSSRREFLTQTAATVGVSALGVAGNLTAGEPAVKGSLEKPSARIPFIHTTDLYSPPQDPDDHVDLATVYALPELDLRAVILDPTRKFTPPLDPGFVPVSQMNYLSGRAVPVAAGPIDPLRSSTDTAEDRPRREQAGVELLLDALRRSHQPVVVSVVGSARTITAAWNRAPKLLLEKVRAVVVNAGATTGKPGAEWNVDLDVHAWVGLFRSRLPIDWYPCTGEDGPTGLNPHNTYWPVAHRRLFADLPQPLRAFFDYAFHHANRGDIVRSLWELGSGASWEKVLEGQRNMWSTASLIAAAGRVLAQMPEGWRFVPKAQAAGRPVALLELQPVACEVAPNGVIQWKATPSPSTTRIFHRKPDAEHVQAMAEAANALLRQFPLG
jgi:hypothetical protein